MNSVIIFGKLPPPTGGVTKSVNSLYVALKIKNITVEIFSPKSLFKRYDIAHIHYSKSWKRFAGLVIGKIIAKKVIFTLHGRKFKSDILNKLNSKFYDGVILLNEETVLEYKGLFKKTERITSLIREGIDSDSNNNMKKYLEKETDFIYILVYAHSKIIENGYDVYGLDFIINNLSSIPSKYKIVLVDPQNSYENDVKDTDVIHIKEEIDFIQILKEIDIYIRPTIKDGDSVAVQEALLLGKSVLASNVVPRPEEVDTYDLHKIDDFIKKITKIRTNKTFIYKPDSITKYLDFVNDIIEKK